MTAEQFTTIASNLITGSGVVFFLWMWVRGLRAQIGTLNETIEVQKKTLEAMEARVLQTEKVGNFYKELYEELPNQVDKWKDAYTKRQEDIVRELEEAIKHKDEKLKETAEIELEKLKLQQRAVEDIPKLREELIEIVGTLRQRLSTVNQLAFPSPPELRSANRYRYPLRLAAIAALLDETIKPPISLGWSEILNDASLTTLIDELTKCPPELKERRKAEQE